MVSSRTTVLDCVQESGDSRHLDAQDADYNKFKSNSIFKHLDMANPDLVRFILEARKRGFNDNKIKEALLSNHWPTNEINQGFEAVRQNLNYKKSLTIWLDKEIISILEKRAKRNLLTLPEQVEDIIRRSVANQRPTQKKEKLDDMLVGLFSRKSRKKK